MAWARVRVAVVAASAVMVVTTAACTGPSAARGGGAASAPTGSRSLTVGGDDVTQSRILQSLYGQLLTRAGYAVTYRSGGGRAEHVTALQAGQLDVVPQYAATFAEYLNVAAHGTGTRSIATSDAAATVAAAQPLAGARGLRLLTPAAAADQNGYAVSAAYAAAHRIGTLSGLAGLGRPIVLAAAAQCERRPFCAQGLEKTYRLDISRVLPLGFGTPEAKHAVLTGEANLAQVSTTDGTLSQLGLRLLADDRGLQPADNVVPVVNVASAGTPQVAAVLDRLSAVLTTEDLAQLNLQVDAQRRRPQDVAREYLAGKGLL